MLNIEDKEEKQDWSSILKSCQLKMDEELEKPPALLEILHGVHAIQCCKRSNITVFKGKGKSGKTSTMALFAAAMIQSGTFMNKFYCPYENLKIGLFDTEESKYDAISMMRIICKLRGIEKQPQNFVGFSLKTKNTKDRIKLIETFTYNSKPDLLIIDGVRDLVKSKNNEEEATDITNELMRFNEEVNCHIFALIHENKSYSDSNATGHLGTEMVNKAETIISTNREPDNRRIFTISDDFARGREEFEPFSFTYLNGIPILKNYERIEKTIIKDKECPF
jgi:hypothetical protein